MKCPHCKKEIDMQDLSRLKKEEVFHKICKEVHSIASLSRKLDIKRSTLRYYINMLLSEKKIYEERLENLAGRPVILKPMRLKINKMEDNKNVQ